MSKKVNYFRKSVTLVVLIVAVVAAFFAVKTFGAKDKPEIPVQQKQTSCLKISLASTACDYNLDEADTPLDRAQGLSGRDDLSSKTGMLFTFEETGEQCMWMKDMKFSIDILWLDSDKKIVKIEPGLAPETYPTNYCQDNTKYVIEIDNGEAEKTGLKEGQQLNF